MVENTQENFNATLKEIISALRTLEQAKEYYGVVIDAAFDAYAENGGKGSKKVLLTVAKAIIKSKIDDAADFHESVSKILSEIAK